MARPPASWSLVSRLTGGVVLIALLSFAAQALVLLLWLRPVAADNAAAAAEQALQMRAALEAVPADARDALAWRLSSPLALVQHGEPPGAEGEPRPLPPDLQNLARQLQREGLEMRLDMIEGAGPALVFRLPVGGQTWWLQRRLTHPAGAVTDTLVVWLALLAITTLGALLVSVRLIARPIGALAAQLKAQQGNLRPLPLRDDASAEMQALVHAFNELVHQVTAAAQARQQLLAGVSHDLRTPLARLRLRAETQCEPDLADALTADLLALERIVNQFLAYVQGDTVVALGTPVPLADIVQATVQRYADGNPQVQLQLQDVRQHAPDGAVQRLLANLIDNALAYGGGAVQVSLRATAEGAELRVDDAGPGMSAQEFERAQQPFVRLTRTRSELGHCGLGLAIVAQVARQLGGRLRPERDAQGRFGIVVSLPRG